MRSIAIATTGADAVWYRVQEMHYAAPMDEWDRPLGIGSTRVHVHEYKVIRETPKGVWLEAHWHFAGQGKRFVLRDAKKRWACSTKEEAIASFRARKARQLEILRAQIERVERAIDAADREFAAVPA